MKRLISFILALAIAFSLCTPLAGCSKTTPMQMGVWLDLVVNAFGMTEYETADPLFSRVPASDVYFGAFQIAAEWDIIDPDDSISSASVVTWQDVLLTLMNAGYFLDEDATAEEKIDYAIANFNPEIRKYWLNRTVSMSDAVPLLDKAVDLWANSTITENIENLGFKGDLLDLTDTALDYETDGNVVILDADMVGDLKPGDVYSLPSIDGKTETSINRVGTIERDGDKVIITNDPDFEGEEVAQYVETIDIEKNVPVDFSYITGIYDENGNPLYTSGEGVNTALASVSEKEDDIRVHTLENTDSTTAKAANLGFFDIKDELVFKAGDFRITLEFEENDFKLTLSIVDYDKSAKRTKGFEPFIELGVKDVSFDKKVKYSGVELETAYAKLNYTQTISGGVKFKNDAEVGKWVTGDSETTSQLSTILREYKDSLASIGKDVKNTNYEGKSIYLCRIALGASGINFIVKGRISCTGEVKITLTMQGAKGIEYRGGKLRYISSSTPGVDMVAEGKFEITIGPGFEVSILKIVKLSVTLDIGVGAKLTYTSHIFDDEGHCFYSGDASLNADQAEALSDSSKLNFKTTAEDILAVAESEGGTWKNYEPKATVTLISRSCLDWYLYPVVKITGELEVNFGTVFGKKIGFTKSAEWKISDDSNKHIILKGHIEFPNNIKAMLNSEGVMSGMAAMLGVGATCSYKPTPWDPLDGETTESTVDTGLIAQNDTIQIADTIMLSSSRVFMDPEQSQQITITGMPKGYSTADLKIEMDKSSVASISITGNTISITSGKQDDTVQVVVSTSDGAYQAFFAITVYENQDNNFEGLGGLVA